MHRPEAGFSDDQTELNWHLGQVKPTKFGSFKKEKNIFFVGKNPLFGPTWSKCQLSSVWSLIPKQMEICFGSPTQSYTQYYRKGI